MKNKKMWGGRFSKKANPLVEEFTKSIQYDYKIALYDLIGSQAHVAILEKAGYLIPAEVSKLKKAIYELSQDILKENFKWNPRSEDIHTNIQNLLQEKVGDLVSKLQMARSRNDQVAFATKLFCRVEVAIVLDSSLIKLISAFKGLAQKNKEIIIPGFTHLQHAQPVYLKDYLNAYAAMLQKDKQRLDDIFKNLKITMGAGALAGTPIDADKYKKVFQELTHELLKSKNTLKIEVTNNSLDAVSDRDFVIEIISAFSIIAMHLSRLAEDLILWSTKEFNFVEIDDAYCTGSSLMPQKKNPDVLELIRGYSGRVYGHLVSVLTMMKGLPLSYNRDMQLDKEPLFESFAIIANELKILEELIKSLKFNKMRIAEHLEDESLYATDIVYYLVNKGVPFKEAHTIVGELVRHSLEKEIPIKEMSDKALKSFSPKFSKNEIAKLFNPKVSVESKKSIKRD